MDREWLIDRLAEGASLDRIAREAQRAPSTVSYWLGRHGLRANGAARYGHRVAIDEASLSAAVAEGLSIPEIARRPECMTGAVRRRLKRLQVLSRQGSWALMRAEAAKCVVLCATCHAEVEAGFSVLSDASRTPRGGLEPPNLD